MAKSNIGANMNILFLCTANKQRSKTAQELFGAADKSNQYKSAGLSAKYVNKAGTTLCTPELLDWANKIYVFEAAHIERIQEHTGDKFLAKITNLQIEDKFQYFQRELVLLLLERIELEIINTSQPLSQEEVNKAIEKWAKKGTGSPSLLLCQDDGSYHVSYYCGMGNSDHTPIDKFEPLFKKTIDQLYQSDELQAFGNKFSLYPGSGFFRQLMLIDN